MVASVCCRHIFRLKSFRIDFNYLFLWFLIKLIRQNKDMGFVVSQNGMNHSQQKDENIIIPKERLTDSHAHSAGMPDLIRTGLKNDN